MHPLTITDLATERHTELVRHAESLRFAAEQRRSRPATRSAGRWAPGLLARAHRRVRAAVLPQPAACCA